MNTVIPKKTRTTTTPMVTSKRLPDKSISMPIFASSSNSNIQNNPKNQQQQRPGKDINHMKREVKGGKHRSGLSVRMDRKFLELTELVRNVLKITSRLACEIEENKKSLKDCNMMTVKIMETVVEQKQILKNIQLSYEDASESESEIDADDEIISFENEKDK